MEPPTVCGLGSLKSKDCRHGLDSLKKEEVLETRLTSRQEETHFGIET